MEYVGKQLPTGVAALRGKGVSEGRQKSQWCSFKLEAVRLQCPRLDCLWFHGRVTALGGLGGNSRWHVEVGVRYILAMPPPIHITATLPFADGSMTYRPKCGPTWGSSESSRSEGDTPPISRILLSLARSGAVRTSRPQRSTFRER